MAPKPKQVLLPLLLVRPFMAGILQNVGIVLVPQDTASTYTVQSTRMYARYLLCTNDGPVVLPLPPTFFLVHQSLLELCVRQAIDVQYLDTLSEEKGNPWQSRCTSSASFMHAHTLTPTSLTRAVRMFQLLLLPGPLLGRNEHSPATSTWFSLRQLRSAFFNAFAPPAPAHACHSDEDCATRMARSKCDKASGTCKCGRNTYSYKNSECLSGKKEISSPALTCLASGLAHSIKDMLTCCNLRKKDCDQQSHWKIGLYEHKRAFFSFFCWTCELSVLSIQHTRRKTALTVPKTALPPGQKQPDEHRRNVL